MIKTWIIALLAIIIISSVAIGGYMLSRSSSTSNNALSSTPSQTPATPAQTPNPTSTSPATTPTQTLNPTLTSTPTARQGPISVTGYALYELSSTEFGFSSGAKTYNVTMDLTTQAVNLNGKLLGGYQIVSQLIPVSSLQLTITGTLSGSTIMAQTILIPTTKDKIT